jgi:hypothetical protein
MLGRAVRDLADICEEGLQRDRDSDSVLPQLGALEQRRGGFGIGSQAPAPVLAVSSNEGICSAALLCESIGISIKNGSRHIFVIDM